MNPGFDHPQVQNNLSFLAPIASVFIIQHISKNILINKHGSHIVNIHNIVYVDLFMSSNL